MVGRHWLDYFDNVRWILLAGVFAVIGVFAFMAALPKEQGLAMCGSQPVPPGYECDPGGMTHDQLAVGHGWVWSAVVVTVVMFLLAIAVIVLVAVAARQHNASEQN